MNSISKSLSVAIVEGSYHWSILRVMVEDTFGSTGPRDKGERVRMIGCDNHQCLLQINQLDSLTNGFLESQEV